MSKSFKIMLISLYFALGFTLLFATILKPVFLVVVVGIIACMWLFTLFLSGKLNLYHYVALLIPSLILSPFIETPQGLPSIKLEDLWLLFGLVLLVIKVAKKKELKIIFPSYAKIFLVFIFWVAVTIFVSSYRDPGLYSNRDWLEVYKNIKLLVIMLIVINVKLDKVKEKKLVDTLLFTLLLSSIFGFMQFFNVLSINTWLTPHFIFESKVGNLETQKRVVATFGNPNMYACALLIGIAFSFSELLNKFKFKYFIYLLVFFVALTTSLSRTALVVSAGLIVIISLMILWKTKRKLKTFLYLSVIPIIVLIGLSIAPDNFFYRISFLKDLSTDNSFQARLMMWENIFESSTRGNMLTGTGPLSNVPITFDNEWLSLLTMFGVVGVVIFIIMFGVIYRNLGKVNNDGSNFYNLAAKGLVLSLAVYMVTVPVFQQLQLMPIIILTLGIVLNKTSNRDTGLIVIKS